jgi:hypothetical protein
MHELWSELLQSGHMIPLPRAQELVNVIYKEHCIDPSLDFHKRFFHEICPLVSIASHISDEVSGIIVSARSANYDGVIVLADE